MSSKIRRELNSRKRHISPSRQEERLNAIDNWAAYVRSTPTTIWGQELNQLIDGQILSAQAAVAIDDNNVADVSGCNPEAIRNAGSQPS